MKNYLMCIVFLTPLFVMAQTNKKDTSKWNFGPRVDLSFTHINGNGIKGGFRPGVQLGAFGSYQFNNKWAIQPELSFGNISARRADDFMTYYVTDGRSAANEKIKLWYVNLPVLARYNIYSDMVSLVAGPQFSYRVYSNENLIKYDVRSFAATELSALAGVEVKVSRVMFSLRYNYGITDLNNIDDRYSWKAQRIQAGVAVRLK